MAVEEARKCSSVGARRDGADGRLELVGVRSTLSVTNTLCGCWVAVAAAAAGEGVGAGLLARADGVRRAVVRLEGGFEAEPESFSFEVEPLKLDAEAD